MSRLNQIKEIALFALDMGAVALIVGEVVLVLLIATAIKGGSDDSLFADLRSDLASPACLAVYSKCAPTSLSPSPQGRRDAH